MTAPVPIASGMRLTPARLNDPAWTTYPVQWTAATTSPTLGNGVLTGEYRYLDAETIFVKIRLNVGSSTNVGVGQYRFSLPVPAVAGGPDPALDGVVLHGGGLYRVVGWANTVSASASFLSMYRGNINAQENLAAWTNTGPVALASGHTFSLSGWYFVA